MATTSQRKLQHRIQVDDHETLMDECNSCDVQLTEHIFETDTENGENDTESLLPVSGSIKVLSKCATTNDGNASNMTPLEMHMNSTLGTNDDVIGVVSAHSQYLGGLIKPYPVGNVLIMFPQFFHDSGWGVLGPHWFGPVCVWLILAGATHLCINAIVKRELGIGSMVACLLFFALTTYRLTDVSLRDPGIVLEKEIPSHVPREQINQYRFCDRCQVWQPPDGVHCPECNLCVEGYDHHCVWMGTCIGKRNYRQFVLFNMSWLYYIGYLFCWILTIGPVAIEIWTAASK